MAKVSKNARTDRKVQEGSKDNVKVIAAYRKKVNGPIGWREVVVHKNNLEKFILDNSDQAPI